VTVALVDVDRLHHINNQHGHAFGDAYLRAVATALTDAANRPGDLVARLGGDELLILTTTPPPALADTLTARLAVPANVAGTPVPLSVSVGISPVTSDAHTALTCADLAMYAAKRRGGGIDLYDPARHGPPPPAGGRPQVRLRDRPRTTNR
jgi:diguanylate cyclase (GGDEF)-like protein